MTSCCNKQDDKKVSQSPLPPPSKGAQYNLDLPMTPSCEPPESPIKVELGQGDLTTN